MKKFSKELELFILNAYPNKTLERLGALDLIEKRYSIKIKNFDGFDALKNLLVLRLDGSGLENFDGLINSNLNHLYIEYLNFDCDLTTLKDLKINKLNIYNSPFKSPDMLNFLPDTLEELVLSECDITDLTFLKRLTKLKSLDLSFNYII